MPYDNFDRTWWQQFINPTAYAEVVNPEKMLEARKELKPKLKQVVNKLDEVYPNIKFRIATIYRSPEEQAKLSPKVTSAKPGQSYHQYSAAADIYPIIEGKIAPYERYKDIYGKIGEIAETEGLTWGGRWKRPFDPAHIQLDLPLEVLMGGK